ALTPQNSSPVPEMEYAPFCLDRKLPYSNSRGGKRRGEVILKRKQDAPGTTFVRLRSGLTWLRGLDPPSQAPQPPVSGSRQPLCASVMHKKGPPRLRAQIAHGGCWSSPTTSTPKASVRFAAFLCEINWQPHLARAFRWIGEATTT